MQKSLQVVLISNDFPYVTEYLYIYVFIGILSISICATGINNYQGNLTPECLLFKINSLCSKKRVVCWKILIRLLVQFS